MKSKKLFAILTLVAFMMTLVPIAAFGAISAVTGTETAGGTNVTVNFTTGATLTTANFINITFPTGTTVPAAIAGGAITINNTATNFAFGAATGAGQVLTLAVPATLTAGANVINFVTNGNVSTLMAGTGTVSVSTSLEAAVSGTYTVTAAASNQFAAVVSTDKTSTTADGSATVKFTVYGYDQYNNVIAAPTYYVASNRGSSDTFSVGTGYTLGAGADTTADATPTKFTKAVGNGALANGKVEFKVSSNIPGAVKIGIAMNNNAANTSIADYMDGVAGATSGVVGLVKVVDITFTAPSANSVALGAAAVPSEGTITGGTGLTSGAPWDTTGVGVAMVNGNGIDTFELSYRVIATNGAPVSGIAIDFAVSDSALTLNQTSATTDGAGIAKVKVAAAKPGTFNVKATAGDKSLTQYVKFSSNQAYTVKLISDNNQKVAKNSAKSFKLKLEDQAGNKITGIAAGSGVAINANNQSLILKATTKPTDCALVENITADNTANYTAVVGGDGYLEFKIAANVLDKEGDYAIKAYFDNGQSVTINFTVKTQGTVTQMTVAYDQASVPLSAVVGSPTVKRLDADGVSKTVDLTSNEITFTVSDVRLVTTGTFNANNGSFTASGDKNYVGPMTITAIDETNKLTANTVVTIAKQTNGFTLTPPTADTAVSTNATVNAQFIDVDGAKVAIADVTAITFDFYVTSKPTGAIVTSSAPGTALDDAKKTGLVGLTMKSTVAGDVTAQVVATVTRGVTVDTYSQNVTVKFGAPAAKIGAKAVTLFIGASGYVQDGAAKVADVAPFIQDGRTFVAVRPLAEAFGATAGWNEATQTVTLTRSDMTLTIVIGKAEITKVAGGITTTIKADVAAFIKDGRTVLPFRAVGEAFGATVSYDAATQAVSFAQ